jgi:hypothetical protein
MTDITEEMLRDVVNQVAGHRQAIEGVTLRLECARIAGERELAVPAIDLIPLARAIYNFVLDDTASPPDNG